MLTVNILCVGKIKETYLKEAINEYSKRLSKYCNLKLIEVSDEKIPEKLSDAEYSGKDRKNQSPHSILVHFKGGKSARYYRTEK